MIFGEEHQVVQSRRVPPTPSRRARMFGADASSFDVGDRVTLTTTVGAGNYASTGRTLGWTNADPAAGNRLTSTGRFTVLAENTSGTTQTVIATSKAQPDTSVIYMQTLSIAPGDTGVLGPFIPIVWAQSDNYVWINASSSDVRLAVIVP